MSSYAYRLLSFITVRVAIIKYTSKSDKKIGVTDRQTEFMTDRQTFAYLELLSQLKTKECINDVWQQRPDILRQIRFLIRLMCNYKVYIGFLPLGEPASKLNPINELNIYQEDPTSNISFNTKLEFENTRHRYSWICSIRDPNKNFHFCSATLLGGC